MSSDNERVEFDDVQNEPKESKRSMGIKDLLNGNILSRDGFSSQVPYFLFLAFIAVLYIANQYRYEKLVKKSQELQIEVKNLRAESITTAAQLMFISKQSEVAKLIEAKGLGLEESVVPPKKVVK